MFQLKRIGQHPRCSRHCGIVEGTVGQATGDGMQKQGRDRCCCVGASVYGDFEVDSWGQW